MSAWGFRSLAPIERFHFRSNVSVHFLDSSHLLLTYNGPRKLLKRTPECTSTHPCRLIHAAVFDLATAKAVLETDWYLHDYRPYLWPLSPGRMLMRRSNSLYVLDSDLNETLLKDFTRDLLWVEVTPDGKQIIAETALEDSSPAKSATASVKQKTESAPSPRVSIDFLNSSSLDVERSLKATGVLEFEASSSGYADSTRIALDNTWLLRFGPSSSQRQRVARIKSTCEPDLLFPTNTAILIGRCSSNGGDYSVSVFSVTGHPLWRQRWPQLNYYPALARSEDGSRFAVGTITASREASQPRATDEDDHGWPDVEQDLRVFETASGKLILAARVKSVVLKNPNFALAPDGSQFVLLDGSILRIYNLPSASAEERAKFLAMAADAPGLAPPTGNSSDVIGNAGAMAGDIDSEDVAQAGEADLRAALREASTAPDATSGLPAGISNAANAPVSTDSVAHTATTDQEPAPAFTFKTTAKEVVVDVLVTDSKGHPVRGLSATDFQIEEDRRPQKIKYFHEFKGSAAAPVPVTPVKLPPNVFSNNSTPPGEKPLVAVVLDLVNTPTQDQQYAKEQLLKFLRKKPADMQFALFALSDGMQILHGFTADENVLAATVTGKSATAAGRKKSGLRSYSDLETTVDMSSLIRLTQEAAASDATFQSSVIQLVQLQSQYRANDIDWRVRLTVEGFTQLAQYLAGLPGRKNIVWMSGSFPSHFFPEVQLDRDTPDQNSDALRDYIGQLRKMTSLLAEAHAAVYPVDVRGVQNDSAYSADSTIDARLAPPPQSQLPAIASSMANSGTNTVSSIQPLSPLQKQMQQAQDTKAGEMATMDEVAKATGGKAFYNTNGIQQAIETAVEQGSTYYTVSYTSDNAAFDGKFRKLRVSLAQKGYHLAYRPGYFADSPQAPVKNPNELAREIGLHAMQHGAPESRQLAFAVRVVPVGKPAKASAAPAVESVAIQPKKVEVQHYAINYAIAGPQLALIPNGTMRRAILDFMVTAFDDDGSIISHIAFRSTNDLKPAGYRDMLIGGLRLHQDMDVPTNAVSMRLGVFDEQSHHLGTLELPLPLKAPPDDAAAQARKMPPVEPD
ncbi:MAG: VWA domain-containing protein [Terracidiphilus sp.]